MPRILIVTLVAMLCSSNACADISGCDRTRATRSGVPLAAERDATRLADTGACVARVGQPEAAPPCASVLSSNCLGNAITHFPTDENWAALPAHPRLFANNATLETVRKRDDTTSLQLRALIEYRANRALEAGRIVYPETGFLFGPAREVQGRILSCALVYRLTGERKYLERARAELLQLCALPEWRTSHFLDVGEAALAAGVGYDWLHDELTPAERERVANAIINNAITPYLATPAGGDSWVDGDFNWTQVCHGGVTVAALAIAEREPALARRVVEHAVSNFTNVGNAYSPDGSHAEGPSYWSYGTSFHVILTEALRTALGTTCGLEKFPGFLRTGDYSTQMVGPTGAYYNYSDYHSESQREPELLWSQNEPVMLWFARENKDAGVAVDELSRLAHSYERITSCKNASPVIPVVINRHTPLELLWWNPRLATAAQSTPPRARHWTAAGVLPIAAMRSAWDDPRASYIAIKGGTPRYSHAHMDVGSFILEADGVRWALDLGSENYDKMRAAKLTMWNYAQDSTRWTTFRVGPEGHNILRFDGARQVVTGKAQIRTLPGGADGTMGDIVELTPLYAGQVASVSRTVKLHPDRTFTIADEWTAARRDTTASWQWLTRANVTRKDDDTLILSQDGQTLALHIKTSANTRAAISIEDVSAARARQDSPNPGLRRIVVTIPTGATQTVQLTVRATPGSVSK